LPVASAASKFAEAVFYLKGEVYVVIPFCCNPLKHMENEELRRRVWEKELGCKNCLNKFGWEKG
jgi:hypothetical protein